MVKAQQWAVFMFPGTRVMQKEAHLDTMHSVAVRLQQYASAFGRSTDITYACKTNKAVFYVGRNISVE